MSDFEGRRVIAVVTKHVNKSLAQLSSLFFDDGTLIGADGLGAKLVWKFGADNPNAAPGSIHVCTLKQVTQPDSKPLFIPDRHITESLTATDWSLLSTDDIRAGSEAQRMLTVSVLVEGKPKTYRFVNRNRREEATKDPEEEGLTLVPATDPIRAEIQASISPLSQRLTDLATTVSSLSESSHAHQAQVMETLAKRPQETASTDRQDEARHEAVVERIAELTTLLTTTQQEIAALQTSQQQAAENTTQQLQSFERAIAQLTEAAQTPQETFDPQSVWSLFTPAFDNQQAALTGIQETLSQPPVFANDLAELRKQVTDLYERMPDSNLSTVTATTVEDRLRPQLLDTSERLSLIRDQLTRLADTGAAIPPQKTKATKSSDNGYGKQPTLFDDESSTTDASADNAAVPSTETPSKQIPYESEDDFLKQLVESINTWCGHVRPSTVPRFHATILTCRCVAVPHVGWGLAYAEAAGQPLHVAHVEPEWLRFETAFDGPLKTAWRQAEADKDRVVIVLLEGVNRSPTAAWLQPWLNLLRGGPVQSSLNTWPENLRMLITFADEPGQFHRQTCLQPAMASVLSGEDSGDNAQPLVDVSRFGQALSNTKVLTHEQWQQWRTKETDPAGPVADFDLSAVPAEWRSSVMQDLMRLRAQLGRLKAVSGTANGESGEIDFSNVATKLRVGLSHDLFSTEAAESMI
ncbi:MAG: hypothetical protein R3C59_05350 [Planctomycetaceae bacterium]